MQGCGPALGWCQKEPEPASCGAAEGGSSPGTGHGPGQQHTRWGHAWGHPSTPEPPTKILGARLQLLQVHHLLADHAAVVVVWGGGDRDKDRGVTGTCHPRVPKRGRFGTGQSSAVVPGETPAMSGWDPLGLRRAAGDGEAVQEGVALPRDPHGRAQGYGCGDLGAAHLARGAPAAAGG